MKKYGAYGLVEVKGESNAVIVVAVSYTHLLRRSLATPTLYVAVRILSGAFFIY